MLVIVGSGPAGLSAARSFREQGGSGPVRMVTRDEHPPYDRPPLSKDFLRGELDEDDLVLEQPSFYLEHDIELVLSSRVAALDVNARVLTLGDGSRMDYDACVLATGSMPMALPVPGGDHPDVLLLRTRAHGRALREAVEGGRSALVVGSGFIGCEAAASLAQRGLEVTMVSPEERPQAHRLGPEVSERIAGWLSGQGVRLVGGRSVESVRDGRAVTLDDGTEHAADLLVVAAGVAPQGGLAEAAGLATQGGRVLADEHLRTNDRRVWTAGDVALASHAAAGRRIPVEHWGDAMTMGEVAGTNAAGGQAVWDEAPGFWSEIGEHTLKYSAWGDGHDDVRLVDHGDGAFTAWYVADDAVVGVLTHEADEDYERGQELVAEGASLDTALRG